MTLLEKVATGAPIGCAVLVILGALALLGALLRLAAT